MNEYRRYKKEKILIIFFLLLGWYKDIRVLNNMYLFYYIFWKLEVWVNIL